MCTLFLLAIISVALLSATPTHGASPVRPTQACMAVDSYHTYVCTEDAEATRRAVASSVDGSGGDASAFASAFDMDLGVEQRITGSEAEQMRIRNVLRRMYHYFEEEVLSRSEYEHVRGKCKNDHELCAFWTSVGECETNRGFMLDNCPAACRLCLLSNTNMMA
ncbi:hypothetical protein ACHAXT_007504 [Thalassiosira profunda]